MSTLPFWLTFGSIEIADYVDTCTFLQNEVYMSFLLRTFFDLTSSLSLSLSNKRLSIFFWQLYVAKL